MNKKQIAMVAERMVADGIRHVLSDEARIIPVLKNAGGWTDREINTLRALLTDRHTDAVIAAGDAYHTERYMDVKSDLEGPK